MARCSLLSTFPMVYRQTVGTMLSFCSAGAEGSDDGVFLQLHTDIINAHTNINLIFILLICYHKFTDEWNEHFYYILV